ncbi:MAG TPA: RIP metalloprotease RseP [Gammaproteobacteria bacterium]|nr:RIP metalloprotease RseP [Gammaproteobacteria bacterium]
MSSMLYYALSFVVALAILIAVHEFGHYWVARRLGVKVLRFSIGFGKPLFSWRSKNGETEYVLAAIPLGGYVRMLDEREGEVKAEELDRAFNRKPLSTRVAVVSAGPLFNFLFAIFALWIMYMSGVNGMKPVVGTVLPDTPAAIAGIQKNDVILAVAGETVPTWQSARLALFEAALRGEKVDIRLQTTTGTTVNSKLDTGVLEKPIDASVLFERLGLESWSPPALLGEIAPGKPADLAGLREGDLILMVNGKPIDGWLDWVRIVRAHPGEALTTRFLRNGVEQETQLLPIASKTGDEAIGKVGVALGEQAIEEYRALGVVVQYGPIEALQTGIVKTWDMSVLMLRVLGRMVTGDASLKNISGPLSIAEMAGKTASRGWLSFLSFLAMVSVSLGVLNLLPVPVLDGGHLLYYLIEFVTGKEVSERVMAVGQQIGISLLLALMGLAFFNDLSRIFG